MNKCKVYYKYLNESLFSKQNPFCHLNNMDKPKGFYESKMIQNKKRQILHNYAYVESKFVKLIET